MNTIINFHGHKINIETSLLEKFEKKCHRKLSIDDMDISIYNAIIQIIHKETPKEDAIEYALNNKSDVWITECIIQGINTDIEIGEFFYG